MSNLQTLSQKRPNIGTFYAVKIKDPLTGKLCDEPIPIIVNHYAHNLRAGILASGAPVPLEDLYKSRKISKKQYMEMVIDVYKLIGNIPFMRAHGFLINMWINTYYPVPKI
ncbi:MAG: hypothetical protein WCJ39_06270 [bacterium]